jgi:hypothetical protein
MTVDMAASLPCRAPNAVIMCSQHSGKQRLTFEVNMRRVTQALFAALIGCVTTARAQWGPWIPINDGNQNRVSISFKKTHDCDGNACVYYWRFQNQYPSSVTLDCQLLITNNQGRETKDDCAVGTLPSGQTKTNGGWWTMSTAEPKVLLKRLNSLPARPRNGGLVYATCDPNPDGLVESCNMRKLECNHNAYEWCESRFGKEGTAKNQANRSAYESCVSKALVGCARSQTECLSKKMHRCPSGQFCDPRFDSCVDIQHP